MRGMVTDRSPGELARRWLGDLALANGGYPMLAQRVGFAKGWALRAARGTEPAPATIVRIAAACGLAAQDVEAIREDAATYHRASLARWDRGYVTFICPGCRETRSIRRSHLGQYRHHRMQVDDVTYEVWCGRCSAIASLKTDNLGDRSRSSLQQRLTEGAEHLVGRFALCALCGLLVYRPRSAPEGTIGWHLLCYRAWRRSPAAVAWAATTRRAQLPGAPPGPGLFPRPASPECHAPPPDLLIVGYRALSGRVEADRARAEEVGRRLPADWDLVFPMAPAGANEERQHRFPLPERLMDLWPERQARADRLARQGIAVEVIARVVGPRPRHEARTPDEALDGWVP